MAVIYIIFAIITAVIFFVSRNCLVTVKKQDFLTVKLDFNLFALELINKGKKRKNSKKSKADKKDRQFYKDIHNTILKLLSRSSVDIKKLCLPIFPAPGEPAEIPFLFANKAFGIGIITYLRGRAKDLTVSDDATEPIPDSNLSYHINLRAPLIFLIYIILSFKLDIIKNKRRAKNYG